MVPSAFYSTCVAAFTGRPTNSSESLNIEEIWPDWKLRVANLALVNNQILYQQGNQLPKSNQLDPQNIQLSNFNLKAEDIELSKETSARLNLTEFSFNENVSNFNLEQFTFNAEITPDQTRIEQIQLKTGSSNLQGEIIANYTSLTEAIQNYERVRLSANINSLYLQMSDLTRLNPALNQNEYILKLIKN